MAALKPLDSVGLFRMGLLRSWETKSSIVLPYTFILLNRVANFYFLLYCLKRQTWRKCLHPHYVRTR